MAWPVSCAVLGEGFGTWGPVEVARNEAQTGAGSLAKRRRDVKTTARSPERAMHA